MKVRIITLLVAAMLVATTACTLLGQKPGQSEAPAGDKAAVGGETVSVNALYVATARDGKAEGGTSEFKITVSSKKEPGIRVSFSESEVGGQGAQMRAAGWSAATMACLLLGVDPSKLSFTYDISGRIDGPSAGGLMTMGTLAAILGDAIPNELTMTGTINPDGSIGAVGGIPHKIDGAAKAGFKTVLVPAGQRSDTDENLGRAVDLVKRGEDDGVEVTLVANIYEAYQAATGKSLPQPAGASRPEMPSRAYDKLKAATAAWLAKYSDSRNRFNSYSATVRNYYRDSMASADNYARLAQNSLNEGAVTVALERAIMAAQTAVPTNQDGLMYQTYLDRGLVATIAQAQASASARTALGGLLDRLKAEQPKTASDVITLIDAYSNYVIAEAAVNRGDAELDYLIKDQHQMQQADILDSLFTLAAEYAEAEIFVEISKTNLDTYLGFGTAPAPSLDTLTGLAEILRRASEANVAAFDSVVVQTAAQQAGVRDEVVKNYLALNDRNLQLLFQTVKTLGIETDRQGQPKVYQIFYSLGGGLNAFALSTGALSKYYSLSAQLDKNFNVTGFRRETALQNMLQLAERRSDQLLGVPKDPSISSLYYSDNARVYRDGNNNDKLSALFYYWQSSILSQVMANMTGEFGDKVQADLKGNGRSADFLKANGWNP